MRNDLYIGAIISLGLHFGLASFSPTKTVRVAAVKETLITCAGWDQKPDEPLELETSEEKNKATTSSDDFRPAVQPDVPQIVKTDSFVVPVQPPVEGKIDRSLVSLPPGIFRSGPGGPGEVIELTKLDQQPSPKFQAKPVYPFDMKKSGDGGEVVVDFIVDRNGDVRNAYAVRSTERGFEESAVQAVSKWKFRPGKKGGVAVNTHMQVPIVFRLGPDGE